MFGGQKPAEVEEIASELRVFSVGFGKFKRAIEMMVQMVIMLMVIAVLEVV